MALAKANAILSQYQQHVGVYFSLHPVTTTAFATAQKQLADFSIPLKAADALHLGIVAQLQRHNATTLVTADGQMARAANSLGLTSQFIA